MTAHVPPPLVDALTVGDFITLVLGLDEVRAAMKPKRPGK
jgi:hypothetical protein